MAEMKPETLLAELNRLRADLDKDPADLEWLTLEHVFRFVSYKTSEFAEYIQEMDEKGEFDDWKEEEGM